MIDREDWMRDVLANHLEEARSRAFSLLEDTVEDENGCKVTATTARRKVKFRGKQTAAYRFVYCVLNEEVLSYDEVVRHHCHNPRCINPEHLEVGTRGEQARRLALRGLRGGPPVALTPLNRQRGLP